MQFTLNLPATIRFGSGLIKSLEDELIRFGPRVLLVHGSDHGWLSDLRERLKKKGFSFQEYTVSGEPELQTIASALKLGQSHGAEVIVGIGGGSAIDTAKATAALIPQTGSILDYLEVIGKHRQFEKKPLPWVAVPTVAGTGAEVTANAVIRSPTHQVKVSLRHPLMLPALTLIDPELTLTAPKPALAASGFDALVQLIEPFVSRFATPFSDSLCREGLKYIRFSLREAYYNPQDLASRERLCLAALFSGLALANAKLGAVHGLAGPLGGILPISHGKLCAALLAPVIKYNLEQLKKDSSLKEYLNRYQEIAAILTGDRFAPPEGLIDFVTNLRMELGLPDFSSFNYTQEQIIQAARQACSSSSMKGNPVVLSEEELQVIISEAAS